MVRARPTMMRPASFFFFLPRQASMLIDETGGPRFMLFPARKRQTVGSRAQNRGTRPPPHARIPKKKTRVRMTMPRSARISDQGTLKRNCVSARTKCRSRRLAAALKLCAVWFLRRAEKSQSAALFFLRPEPAVGKTKVAKRLARSFLGRQPHPLRHFGIHGAPPVFGRGLIARLRAYVGLRPGPGFLPTGPSNQQIPIAFFFFYLFARRRSENAHPDLFSHPGFRSWNHGPTHRPQRQTVEFPMVKILI